MDPLRQYQPPKQFAVGTLSPEPWQYLPAVHKTQFDSSVCPVRLLKVPSSHSIGTLVFKGQYLPDGHMVSL